MRFVVCEPNLVFCPLLENYCILLQYTMCEKQTSPNLNFPSGSRRTSCCLRAPGAESSNSCRRRFCPLALARQAGQALGLCSDSTEPPDEQANSWQWDRFEMKEVYLQVRMRIMFTHCQPGPRHGKVRKLANRLRPWSTGFIARHSWRPALLQCSLGGEMGLLGWLGTGCVWKPKVRLTRVICALRAISLSSFASWNMFHGF